jgi:hypothetical protein
MRDLDASSQELHRVQRELMAARNELAARQAEVGARGRRGDRGGKGGGRCERRQQGGAAPCFPLPLNLP